eukprot:scaffold1381_cov386-Prasinococcus_capsulatus_cf.AAC.17
MELRHPQRLEPAPRNRGRGPGVEPSGLQKWTWTHSSTPWSRQAIVRSGSSWKRPSPRSRRSRGRTCSCGGPRCFERVRASDPRHCVRRCSRAGVWAELVSLFCMQRLLPRREPSALSATCTPRHRA